MHGGEALPEDHPADDAHGYQHQHALGQHSVSHSQSGRDKGGQSQQIHQEQLLEITPQKLRIAGKALSSPRRQLIVIRREKQSHSSLRPLFIAVVKTR